MASEKQSRPKARTVRGFRDRAAGELVAERKMLETIARTYESYGFDPLETPFVEYTDALGKFLPDVDRPNAGVFSFRDDDEQWVSLRYDLTAPLARYVAENYQDIAKPFRRYQIGTVFRNDKPGPGRFREFIQCDADTVGTASPAADAEMVMMFADTLEALGLQRGDYAIKLNSRKLLDGVLEACGLTEEAFKDDSPRRTIVRAIVLRAIDKLDRLGVNGVRELLGVGRQDESGDYTEGAGLTVDQTNRIMSFVEISQASDTSAAIDLAKKAVEGSKTGESGISDLATIMQLVEDAGYSDRVQFDTTIIRGLDYYTGAVFEAQLTFPVQNEKGQDVVFGSVGGGGRYDDLVARFTGQQVPAVGFSIGVSRLASALRLRNKSDAASSPLVVVTVFDKKDPAPSFALVRELRTAFKDDPNPPRFEAYVGTGKMGDQFKYADRRGAAIAVIQGPDEQAKGEVQLKDLALGAELAKSIESRAAWVGERQAQIVVPRSQMVDEVRAMLNRKA